MQKLEKDIIKISKHAQNTDAALIKIKVIKISPINTMLKFIPWHVKIRDNNNFLVIPTAHAVIKWNKEPKIVREGHINY